MTRPPADMPRDYSDHADLMAALSAENDIDVQAAIRAAVDRSVSESGLRGSSGSAESGSSRMWSSHGKLIVPR